jgi:hypothetical protein
VTNTCWNTKRISDLRTYTVWSKGNDFEIVKRVNCHSIYSMYCTETEDTVRYGLHRNTHNSQYGIQTVNKFCLFDKNDLYCLTYNAPVTTSLSLSLSPGCSLSSSRLSLKVWSYREVE